MTTSIVVGGSSGIGRFIAQRFADRGDEVVITSRSLATAESVAQRFADRGDEVVITSRSLATAESVAQAIGGTTRDRPYPGSTMVTTVNGGVSALVRTLTNELAPHRIKVIHPGVVGDSPKWIDVPNHPHLSRTPIGRLVTMQEIADATDFLLTNEGVNGQDLVIDGGMLAT